MKEYDEATLKKVQQTEMEILRDFIKVCDENNLTWFGDAGSGIGAIRNKINFIIIKSKIMGLLTGKTAIVTGAARGIGNGGSKKT